MSVLRYRRSWRRNSLEESGKSYETQTILLFPLALLSSAGHSFGSDAFLLSPEPTETALPELHWTQVEEYFSKSTALLQGSALPELHWSTVEEVLGNPTAMRPESPMSPFDWPIADDLSDSLTGHEVVNRRLDNLSGQVQSDVDEWFPSGERAPKRLCVRDSVDRAGPSWEGFVKLRGNDWPVDRETEEIACGRVESNRSDPSDPSTSRGEDEKVSSVCTGAAEDLGLSEPSPTRRRWNRFEIPPSDEGMLSHGLPILLGFTMDRKTVNGMISPGQNIAEFFASKSAADIRNMRECYEMSVKPPAAGGDEGLALMRVLHWILRAWGTSHERPEIHQLLNRNVGKHLRLTLIETETDRTRPTGSSDGECSLPFRLEAGGKEIDLTNIPWRVTTDSRFTTLTLIAFEGENSLILTMITPKLLKSELLRESQNKLFSEIEAAHSPFALDAPRVLRQGFRFLSTPAVTPNAALEGRKGIFEEILQPQSLVSERATECCPFDVRIHPEGKMTATFNATSANKLKGLGRGPTAGWKKENFVDVDELSVDKPEYAFLRDNCQIHTSSRQDRGNRLQFKGRLTLTSTVDGTPATVSVGFVDVNCPPRFVESIRNLKSGATVYEPSSGPWVIGFPQPERMLKTAKLADSPKGLLRVPSGWRTQKSPPIHLIPLKTAEDKLKYSKAKTMEKFLPKLTKLPFTEILRTLKDRELREIAALHWPFDASGHTDSAPVNSVSKVESITDFESFVAFADTIRELHNLWSVSPSPMTWNTEVYSCIDSYCKRSLSLSLDSNGSKILKLGSRHFATASLPIATRRSKGYLHGILALRSFDSILLLHLKTGPLIQGPDEVDWTESRAFCDTQTILSTSKSWQNAPVGLSILTSEGLYTLQGDRWKEWTLEDLTAIGEGIPSSLCTTSDSVV